MIYQQLGEIHNHPGATMNWLKNVGALAGRGGKNIVLDCGIGFVTGPRGNDTYTGDIDALDNERVDLIVISHCHADHIVGSVVLAKRHPEAIIVMSQPTVLSGWIIINDTLKIAIQAAKEAMRRGETPEPLLFDAADVDEFFNRIVQIEHPQWVSPWEGWEIGFHNNGHTRGAMSTFIIPPHGRPIYHTADTCSQNLELTNGVLIPSQDFTGDFFRRDGLVIITEATNGARSYTQADRDAQKALLLAKNFEVKRRYGRVLDPSFAEGRSASLAKIYADAGIPSHVDGLAREFLRTYAMPDSLWCDDDIPFPLQEMIDKKLVFFFEEDNSVARYHRTEIDRGYDKCAEFSPIISPSATMDKGYAVWHALEILPQKESAVIFAGHVFPDTPSAELLAMNDPTARVERGKTIKLNGIPVDVRAEVLRVNLTAHDGREGLLERIRLATNVSRESVVIGHHGDEENRRGLAEGVSALGLPYLDGVYMKEYDL